MVKNTPLRLSSSRILTFIFCMTLVVLAACRPQAAVVQPTAVSVIVPTPRSTPLPAIATVIPPGQTDNPLQMVIRPDGDMKAAQTAASDFEQAILKQSGLVVQVKVVERYAEAVAALCGSTSGSAVVAWLNGLSYTAARAQNCGEPIMQVQRGSGSNVADGQAVSIIVGKDASFSSVAALKDKVFCRIGNEDMSTWLLPSLMLEANQVTPLSLKAVTDYPDVPKLVKAVAAGNCDAAGIAANALDQYAADIGDAANQVKTLDTSIEFPYAILMIPVEVPLGTRLSLSRTLVTLSESSDTAVKMRALLGQKTLKTANVDDFIDLAKFMTSTGLDFAQLGN